MSPTQDLEDTGLENNTPHYGLSKDEKENKQSFPQLAEELEPMPEVGDHYIGAEILLPREDQMAWNHTVAQSCDASGNFMGSAHAHPVVFASGKVTELTTNVIAGSMYAQYDADENEYLLLDLWVDYLKDDSAISFIEHQITVQLDQ